MCFLIRLENSEKNRFFESTVRLLDKPRVQFNIPDTEFSSVISLPSSEFQKICKNMNSLGNDPRIEIKSVGSQLAFYHKGEFSDQKIVFSKSSTTDFDSKNGDEIIQGLFNLKFLILFSKATNLCNTVQIYLKNDFPLVLEYSVGSLGSLRFLLVGEQASK
jgi:proliferating cell nuclear antigen